MKGMEKFLLSFGLSLAVTVIMGLIMNYVWSVGLYPTLISLISFILIMSAIAWFRRRRFSESEIINAMYFKPLENPKQAVKLKYRIALWILLLALSAVISFSPVNIKLDASSIQSLHIFISLPLFAAIFIIWIAALLFLLFTKRDGSSWEKLALVCVFAWIFRNFWVIITPNGFSQDSLGHLGMVRLLQEFGKMPPGQISYWGFPGFHLFANSFVQVSGLNLFKAAQFIIIFENLLFTALLFKMSSNFLKSSYLAPFATILVLMTVPLVQHFEFVPHTFAAILALGYVIILTRDENRVFGTMADRLLAIILFLTAAICVFWYPMLLFFILVGRYLTQLRTKERVIELPFILFSAVVIIAWQLYFAKTYFKLVSSYLPTVMNNFLTGAVFSTSLQRAAAISSVSVPLWAQATQYFWIFIIAGLGTFLGLVRLTQIKKLNPLERMEVAAILGTVLFFIIVFAMSKEGYYASDYITLVRIFSALLVVRFFLWVGEKFQNRFKLKFNSEKTGIILLVGVLFIVSFPSFLVEGKDVSAFAVYPQEITAGKYLQSLYGDGTSLTVYTNQPEVPDILHYYLPSAIARSPTPYYLLYNKEALFQDMNGIVNNFEQKNRYSIFVFSEKTLISVKQTYGIDLNDPYWINMKKQLADFVGGNNVWSNGFYSIYFHPK